ncbi:MAG: hypothetical protein IKW88_11255 [Clostridiales bacterium]|nr:hypothetical protein [Clostridiales bacterium]
MKTKILIIMMHLIMAIAGIATIASFVCFLVFPKTTGTVTAINAPSGITRRISRCLKFPNISRV